MLYLMRSYIKKNQSVSITQISREFKMDLQAIKPILDIWVKKGVISIYNHPLACKSGCGSCKQIEDKLYYCWVD